MNNEKSIKKLCEHMSISPDIKSTYQSNLSKKIFVSLAILFCKMKLKKLKVFLKSIPLIE